MPLDPTSTDRVFVSSTCYDLVDVRAELSKSLLDAGLKPVLSDLAASDFVNSDNTNSIELCLVNLRTCSHCIVVLSQRYGPSLKNSGFEDISATHLEYREAVKTGKHVLFYVRDRLKAEYDVYRKNKGMKTKVETEYPWAQKDALKLFGFIDEHSRLTSDPQSNWFWPFTSSVDLRERVVRDLGAAASEARLRRLTEAGQMPLLNMYGGDGASNTRSAALVNNGSVAALRVVVRQVDGQVVSEASDLQPHSRKEFRFNVEPHMLALINDETVAMRVEYETPLGDRLCEAFALWPHRNGLQFVPVGRRLLGRSLRTEGVGFTTPPEYGWCRVPAAPISQAMREGRA